MLRAITQADAISFEHVQQLARDNHTMGFAQSIANVIKQFIKERVSVYQFTHILLVIRGQSRDLFLDDGLYFEVRLRPLHLALRTEYQDDGHGLYPKATRAFEVRKVFADSKDLGSPRYFLTKHSQRNKAKPATSSGRTGKYIAKRN